LGRISCSLFYKEGSFVVEYPEALFSLEPLWILSLLSNVITLAFLVFLSHGKTPLSSIRFLLPIAALATALGTLLISHPILMAFSPASTISYSAGAVLTGVGSAMVVVLWGEQFTIIGSSQTVSRAVPAQLLGSAAYFLITTLPSNFAQLITALLPVASIVFLHLFKRRRQTLSVRSSKFSLNKQIPWRLIGISLFFGASFGIMKGLFAINEGGVIALRDLLNIVAIAAGSLAIYATVKILRMDFDHLTYQIALPLMALGFIFLPLHDPFNIIGTAAHQFGYQYFYIVLWAIWPVLARRSDVQEGWIVSWGMLSIQSGQFVGSIVTARLRIMIDTDFEMAMVSCVAVWVILLIALFALGTSSAKTGWGFLKPIEDETYSTRFQQTCHQLAWAYHLSPRETEVFILLAKGRNRPYISKTLVVSDETVKTHAKSIYRKLSVHSQQEIIDFIEAEDHSR
jgi:DNA-binding CsgD family transcriptional regulator